MQAIFCLADKPFFVYLLVSHVFDYLAGKPFFVYLAGKPFF